MRAFALVAAPSLLALALAGCPGDDKSEPPACVGQQALTAAPVFGTSMALKQIALSFDDGPGARTAELSTYLKGQGIRATFFVNNNAQQAAFINVLPQLVADGHVIGNHTKNHPDLTTQNATQIVAEVTDVDTLIAPYVPNNRFLFRAPFGAWNADVFNALQASPMKKYVGHIEWEAGDNLDPANKQAADFACWQGQAGPPATTPMTSKACGDLYVQEIEGAGKGIVLMHDADYGDSSNTNIDAGKGNTVDMVKYIVPVLKAKGFTFIGVDEVPDIAAVLPPLPPKDAGADATPDAGTSSSSSSSGGSSTSSGGSSGVDAGDPCPPAATTTPRRVRVHTHHH